MGVFGLSNGVVKTSFIFTGFVHNLLSRFIGTNQITR
jgi:hypothetical protein